MTRSSQIMTKLACLLAALTLAMASNGCRQPSTTPNLSSPAAQASQAAQVVRGRVLFQGDVPASSVIAVPPPLDAMFPNGIVSARYRVSPDRGLAEVVVSIVNPPSGGPLSPGTPTSLVVSNTLCYPRALAVHTNQAVRFTVRGNPMLNLTAIGPKDGAWNRAVTRDTEFEEWFPVAGIRYRITDNVHPWLTASVWTFDHRWFAVTDAEGRFELPPLPPGRYTVQFEHRLGGSSTREIEVPGTGEALALTMRADAPPAGP